MMSKLKEIDEVITKKQMDEVSEMVEKHSKEMLGLIMTKVRL